MNFSALFGSFGYAKVSLYDRHLSLVLLLLLASVSVDSSPINFKMAAYDTILSIYRQLLETCPTIVTSCGSLLEICPAVVTSRLKVTYTVKQSKSGFTFV